MEDLGRVVDQIRRNRNITIETLCEGIISASTYSRFVNGKTFLASDSFIKIISRLHMTFAMFLQDHQLFFKLKHDYAILNHAKAYHEVDVILDLIKDYQVRQGKKGWQAHDERFLKVAQLLANLMTEAGDYDKQLLEQLLNEAKQLLGSLTHFTDNDFFAVKFLLPYLSFEEAEKLMKKHLKKLLDLKEPTLAENLYYVAGLMYTKSLTAKKRKAATVYYKMLTEIYLDQMDLGWKMAHKMYTSIHLYFAGETETAMQDLEDLSVFYNDLNLCHQAEKIHELTQELGIPLKQVKVSV